MRGTFLAAAVCVVVSAAVQATFSAQESPSVWNGVYTEGQATRGESVYLQHCSECHGVDLAGMDDAPPLSGGLFLANWNGLTLGDFFQRVRVTMPLDNPNRVSRDEKIDILAYVLSANNFPAGTTELPSQIERLGRILFDAYNRP